MSDIDQSFTQDPYNPKELQKILKSDMEYVRWAKTNSNNEFLSNKAEGPDIKPVTDRVKALEDKMAKTIKVGDFGVGDPIQIPDSVDLDTVLAPGTYSVKGSAPNWPHGNGGMLGVEIYYGYYGKSYRQTSFVIGGAETYREWDAGKKVWTDWIPKKVDIAPLQQQIKELQDRVDALEKKK